MLKATDVRNIRVMDKGNLKAFVSIMFAMRDGGDGVITINDCKLMDGEYGMYVAPPSRSYEKDGETKWSDIVFLDGRDDDVKELKKSMTEVAVKAYNRETGSSGNSKPKSSNKPARSAGSFDDDDFDF